MSEQLFLFPKEVSRSEVSQSNRVSNIKKSRWKLASSVLAVCLFSMASLFYSATASAQIIVFTECNFQGKATTLQPGLYDTRALGKAGVGNDSIASIVVPDGFSTTLYVDNRFKGRSGSLFAASSCLDRDRFKDVVSSLTVQARGEEDAVAAAAAARYPARGAAPSGATFYSFCDYRGVEVALPPGEYRLSDLQEAGINNNDISSLKVPRGYQVSLFANDFFRGKSLVLGDNDNCLRDNGIDEQVTSVIVRADKRITAGASSGSSNNQPVATDVVAYSECGYFGIDITLPPGEYKVADLEKLGMPNNAISSFKVPAGYAVAIYENDFFRGAGKVLEADDKCLIGDQLNDKISSIVVEAPVGAGSSTGSTMASTSRTESSATAGRSMAAAVYTKCGFEGERASLDIGEYNAEDLAKLGIRENSISSVKVNPGYRVDLYFFDFLRGKNGFLEDDDNCLSNDGFDNEISSIKVSKADDSAKASVPTTPVASDDAAVTVYGQCDFEGGSVSLEPGRYTQEKLRGLGIGNDVIASLKVREGHTVVLYDNGQMRGRGVAFKADDACLDDDGLYRKVSAVVIVPDRRKKAGNSSGAATISNNSSTLQQSRADVEAGLQCIGLYVQRNICEGRRWNDMRKRCNLDEVAALSDGYLEGHVRAGNCTTQYWTLCKSVCLIHRYGSCSSVT